jgi:nitrogen fixation protein NifQ
MTGSRRRVASRPAAADAAAAAVAARCDELTGGAAHARTADARLFARLVAAREVRGELAWLGLSPQRLAALFERHFVVAVGDAAAVATGSDFGIRVGDANHAAFVAAMRDMLVGFASSEVDRGDAQCVATIIAHACLRPDHLWRDLRLGGRDDVTAMLERFFPALVARNLDGTRWKKFLARELALATGTTPGPSPGCPGCEDFGFCFPEGR